MRDSSSIPDKLLDCLHALMRDSSSIPDKLLDFTSELHQLR
jgi:hypothetical protein